MTYIPRHHPKWGVTARGSEHRRVSQFCRHAKTLVYRRSSHPPLAARDSKHPPSPLEFMQTPQKGSILPKQETSWVSYITDRTDINHLT